MSNWFRNIILATMMLALTASPAAATMILKLGTATQPTHIYNVAARYFAKLVKKASQGEIQVQVFPAAQLGSERDMVEGLQMGSLEMTLTSTGPVGNFVPQVRVFNLPYLFNNRRSAYKVLDGPIGAEIAGRFPKIGIRVLGWFENGFRDMTDSVRPIHSPQDVKGLKIRVMEDKLFVISMKALGASPVPMAFGELYTALAQKTVDGEENPLAVIYSSRFYEVQKYLAITEHFYSPAMLLISEITWKKLTPGQQKIMVEAAAKARNYERNLSIQADQKLEAKLKNAGMVVTHPDKAPFIKAVAGVYENPEVLKAIGGGNEVAGRKLVEEVRAEIGG